jgi:hypothetical protein
MAKHNHVQIQPLVSVITLGINTRRNGVEIRFPDDPGEEVRDILTEQGWRFNPYGATTVRWPDPTWYKRLNQESLKFARDLVQLLGGVDNTGPALAALAATPQAAPVPPAPQAPPMAVVPAAAPEQVAADQPPVAAAAPAPAQEVGETVEIKVPALAA